MAKIVRDVVFLEVIRQESVHFWSIFATLTS